MRTRRLETVLSACFFLLILSLLYTQIFRYPFYSKLSKNNVIRIIPIDGPRGMIFDRNGTTLVSNRLSFDLAIVYQELKNRSDFLRILSDLFGMSRDEALRSLRKASQKPYAPVVILEDIAREKAIYLEEASSYMDGLVIETRSRRHYLYDDSGSHLFGYLTEITEEELEDLKGYGYRAKDLVGRSGLEKCYDRYLTGVAGGVQIQVDNKGRQRKVLGLKEPSSGKDLYLTIDISLQTLSDRLLGDRAGAIVVMNPQNGEVLALASHPSFDPNVFVKAGASRERLNLINDKGGKPLVDRAIAGLYPPGSIFKVVVATAALNTKKITRDTRFFCSGVYALGKARFNCWKEGGHGQQNVVDGLMNSCNIFFYNTGRAAGVDNIEMYAKLFGFGRPTGIDLPDEAAGLLPGRLWKRLYKGENWYEGDTVNYSIGQGYLLVTPIQVLEMMSVIANKGSLIRPYLVKKIDNAVVQKPRPKRLPVRDAVIQTVREGLFNVVNAEHGTARRAQAEGVHVAGKTGTAQNPHGRTHAWFSGFAPYEDPRLCVVVFLEHGGKGGLDPTEIARNIFEEAKAKGYI